MKFIKYFIALIVGLMVFSLLAFLFVKNYDKKAEARMVKVNYTLADYEYDLIENGDIILRKGYGFISDMIVNRLNERVPISHCAIIEKTDSTSRVIHSVSQTLADFDGVQSQSLQRFVKDSKENSIIVVRFKYPENQDASKITQRARHYLDKKVPFDMKFNIQDSTRFYCTELIWKVLLDGFYIDIFEKKHDKNLLDFYRFDVFLDTTYFDLVWSHQEL